MTTLSPSMQHSIELLKAQAREQYTIYYSLLDGYDCGSSLGEYINPEASQVAAAFNKTMDELGAIDPSAPKKRL